MGYTCHVSKPVATCIFFCVYTGIDKNRRKIYTCSVKEA